MAQDLATVRRETFAERLSAFLELCQSDPALRLAIAPLRAIDVDVSAWFTSHTTAGVFGAAQVGFSLPQKSTDRAAASLAILERIERDSLDAWRVGVLFVGVNGNFDDRLAEFYDRFVQPLVRFITRDLRERYDSIAPERTLPPSLEQHIEQLVHVEGHMLGSAIGKRDASVRIGNDAGELAQIIARELDRWRSLAQDLETHRAHEIKQALDVLSRALTEPARPTQLAAAAETVVTSSSRLRQAVEQFTVEVAAGIAAQGLAPAVLGLGPAVLHALQLALAAFRP